jgi:hypothetical protein
MALTDFKKSYPKRTEPKMRYRVRNRAEYGRALVARGSVAPWFEDGAFGGSLSARLPETQTGKSMNIMTRLGMPVSAPAVHSI